MRIWCPAQWFINLALEKPKKCHCGLGTLCVGSETPLPPHNPALVRCLLPHPRWIDPCCYPTSALTAVSSQSCPSINTGKNCNGCVAACVEHCNERSRPLATAYFRLLKCAPIVVSFSWQNHNLYRTGPFFLHNIKEAFVTKTITTSLPYFRVKLSCVCLMFAYRK